MIFIRLQTLAVVALLGAASTVRAEENPRLAQMQPAFHSTWQHDACVQKRQSWDDYWQWVHVFYLGGNGKPGWFSSSARLLQHVTSPDARAKADAKLQTLGERTAAEWSKDNSCRKIRTTRGLVNFTESGKPAIEDWASELLDAASHDSGNGQTLLAAIDDVSAKLSAALETAK